jgi:hypothetical protein
MSNQYRALSPSAKAAYSDGVFDAEFTVEQERDVLGNGVLELVPRQYRVLVDNYRLSSGEVFEGAYPIELEAALIDGGVIERVRRDAVPTVDELVDEASLGESAVPARRRTRTRAAAEPAPSDTDYQ